MFQVFGNHGKKRIRGPNLELKVGAMVTDMKPLVAFMPTQCHLPSHQVTQTSRTHDHVDL